jgi:hypothetical protein
MATPRYPRKGLPYSEADLSAVLTRLPDTLFGYRELARAVADAGLAEGRGLVPMVANTLRTRLLILGRLQIAGRTDGAALLQKVGA